MNQHAIEEALQAQLRSEGFKTTYIWQDAPDTFYADHTHPTETAHIILDGEMTLTSEGKRQIYRRRERCDVPAGAVHSARMGPKGCRYLIASAERGSSGFICRNNGSFRFRCAIMLRSPRVGWTEYPKFPLRLPLDTAFHLQ
jgi:hypothetical protein